MESDHVSETVVISREQCLTRLASAQLGRIGVSIDALPVILPVHFALVDESVLFRTTLGTRLDSAASSAVVAFQVDAYDSTEPGWWSVLLQGVASPVPERETEMGSDGAPPGRDWSSAGKVSHLLRVRSQSMTGRLFRGTAYQPPSGSELSRCR
jgi:uncharacterized protein